MLSWTRTVALLCAFPAAAARASAQAPPVRVATQNWIVERWSTDQGLPQATVTDIAQTPDGYLWLATFGGLVRFDGVRFTAFTSADYPALGSDRVYAMRTGPDGALWLGTDHALVQYRDGQFREWSDSAGRPRGYTTGLFVDSTGPWITTSVDGLGHLVGDHFERFASRGLADGYIGAVVRDRAGNVWAHRADTSEFLLASGAARFVRQPVQSHNLIGTTLIGGLSPDGLPMFLTSQGAARWDGRNLLPVGVGGSLVAADGKGGYWSATSRGVTHIDAHGTVDLVATEQQAGISFVRSLFVDRDGTLWLGTTTLGLVRFRRRLVHMYFHDDGLAVEQVAAIMRDDRQRLIVGSSCGVTSTMEQGRLAPSTLPGCAFSMAQGTDGTLWVAPIGGLQGVARTGVAFVPPFAAQLSNKSVLAMYADRDTSLWLGTENGLAHEVHGTLRQYTIADGLPATEIHYITRDRHGVLWVGTVGGVARLDGARFTAWTTANGLAHNYVRAIYEDTSGTHWIGTYGGGLSRFDGTHFVTIARKDGLYDNIVSSIHEDAHGNLWMAGNRGIYRANRQSLNAFANGAAKEVTSVGYGPSDGLLTSETNGGFEPSAWQDTDGRLWFATVRGLATIDPAEAVTLASAAPSVAIETFLVDGRAMPTMGTVRLPVGSRSLEITYTGLTSIAPEQLAFRYRLDGLSREWVYVNARRTAYYPTLPRGAYTFTVSAANRDGAWSTGGPTLSFVVPSPWYATPWFRAFALLAATSVVVTVVRQRIRRVLEREQVQRDFSRQLLLGQEIERGRLAGELHDSLGQDLLVMKNRAAMALATESVSDAARGHIEEIASVATQAVQHAREMSHGLRPYQLKHLGLTASLAQLCSGVAAANGIDISLDARGIDDRLDEDDAIQMYRIVQEALNNIVKHAAAQRVSVTLAPDETGVALTVSDNGRGMDAAQPFGFGLTGIQQRVHLLGGTMIIRTARGAGMTMHARFPSRASRGPS